MKRFLIHIGIGLSIVIAFLFADFLFYKCLNWMDKVGIVGASWLALARYELLIGTVVVLLTWFITLFCLPFQWYKRFYFAAVLYLYGIGALFGGVFVVSINGFLSKWFYKIYWPIGAIFRIIEILACIGVLSVLGLCIFMIIFTMFTKSEEDNKEVILQ